MVNTEDYIIGDLNGVVCVPRVMVKDTITLLVGREEPFRRIAEDIEAGAKFAKATY